MSELYTVRILRKQIITKFLDKRGKQKETREELVEQVYCDLPYATALNYKNLLVGAEVSITRQAAAVEYTTSGHSRSRVGVGNATKPVNRRDGGTVLRKREDGNPGFKPASDYADLINKMVKEEV